VSQEGDDAERLRFAVLGSGSKGNATVVRGGGKTILVDCGYSAREMRRRLAPLDVELSEVDALFITHGHGDHIKGVKAVASAMKKVVYATEGTHLFAHRSGGMPNLSPIVSGQVIELGGLSVRAFGTPHDAPGSLGFTVDDGRDKLGICSDLGKSTDAVEEALSRCHGLILEFNHDPDMLRNGPYPERLKRRVASDVGHLSNGQAAQILHRVRGPRLTRVLLAHLSEVNNTPNLALAAARQVLGKEADESIEVAVAPQHHPTGWLRVRRRGAVVPDAERHAGNAANENVPGPRKTLIDPAARRKPEHPAVVTTQSVAVRRQLSLFGGPGGKTP
jgi:phosphoribosyl 1,2-cyclic phosphodiesterase